MIHMTEALTAALLFCGSALADGFPSPRNATSSGVYVHTAESTSVVYPVTHAADTYSTGSSTKDIKTHHTRTLKTRTLKTRSYKSHSHKTSTLKKHTSSGTREYGYAYATAWPTYVPTGLSTKETKTHHTRTFKVRSHGTRSHKTRSHEKHTSTSSGGSDHAYVTTAYLTASTSHSFITKPSSTQPNNEWPLCLRGGDCTTNAVPTAVYPTAGPSHALEARAEPIAESTTRPFTVKLGPVPFPGEHFTTAATSDSNKKIRPTGPRHVPELNKPTSAHYHNASASASLHTISYHPIRTTIPPSQATSMVAPKYDCTASFLTSRHCCEVGYDDSAATTTTTKTMPCGSCATATVIGIANEECEMMKFDCGPPSPTATEYVCADNKPSRATCLDDVKEKGICRNVAFLYSDEMLCYMRHRPEHCRHYQQDQHIQE